jgi:hypothetical protein
MNEWTYCFVDSDGAEWQLNLIPWYESMSGPWDASLEYGEKHIPLRFSRSYTDYDIDQLKEDALRRVMALFPNVEFPLKELSSHIMTQYIADEAHFKEVIARVANVKKHLWIGTADIKDLYVGERPFLGVLADLISKGREIRLIHAKEPGPNFREDFDRYPVLFTGLERVLCPRVHFKIIIFDLKTAYIGSANLTGAGLGMKSTRNRNFEAGILTDDPDLVEAAINQFDSVWAGFKCKSCGRKQYCSDPVI